MRISAEEKEKTKALILACFKNHYLKHGVGPSIREICEGANIPSTSTVYKYLRFLAEDGKIVLEEGKSRIGRIPGLSWEYELTPLNEERVLVYTAGKVTTGFYGGGKWHVGDKLLDKVDAWIYIPEVGNE